MVSLRRFLPYNLVLLAPFVESARLPLHRRGTIASDEIVGFDQTVPDNITGDVYLGYQPYLYVVNGCVPFPAVDADGNTNAGLKPTGDSDGDCGSNTGQIYVRATTYNGYYALMYSWYFPKDEPSDGLGHRHDWEGVVVWLTHSETISADNIVAVCPSAHGDWDCTSDGYTLDGTKPLIKYQSYWPLDHALYVTSTEGGTEPLIDWGDLPSAAQEALRDTDFGDAIVPFKDSTFTSNLAECSW